MLSGSGRVPPARGDGSRTTGPGRGGSGSGRIASVAAWQRRNAEVNGTATSLRSASARVNVPPPDTVDQTGRFLDFLRANVWSSQDSAPALVGALRATALQAAGVPELPAGLVRSSEG